MICVEEGVCDNLPGLVPWKIFFIEENSHQFRNCKSWVSLRRYDVMGKLVV